MSFIFLENNSALPFAYGWEKEPAWTPSPWAHVCHAQENGSHLPCK